MEWHQYLLWMFFVAYLADQVYFQKRRTEKFYAEQRKKMVDGIIADLKESDTTLVIDSSKGEHGIISKGPDVTQ